MGNCLVGGGGGNLNLEDLRFDNIPTISPLANT
jgi:hypothetical protein